MVWAFNDNVMINMTLRNDMLFLSANNNQHHNKSCFPHWDFKQDNNKWICWAKLPALMKDKHEVGFDVKETLNGPCPQFLSDSQIVFVMNIIHLYFAASAHWWDRQLTLNTHPVWTGGLPAASRQGATRIPRCIN